jgi:tetratricopeptide (TPR) repeat protein
MSIKGLLALGELNEQEGNSAEAQKAYQEALKREPENVQARRSLALLHTRKRELKKAIGNYEILFKNRDEVTSGDCLELALLCWETGNEKKAQEYLSRAISLEPDSPDCLLKIILMGEMRNKEKSAARLLQKISKEVISREVASEYLAASLIERLKYNEAAETLQSSSGKIPERSLSCYCYGMARMGEKKYAEALSAFKKARSLAREKDLLIKGLIYCSMGHIHAEKGNFKTGLAQLTAASTAAGEFLFPAKVDYETARLYALKGESSKALIFLRKSIRAGFNNSMLLKKDPSFDKLRKNSEFIRLSGMIHAPQEQN